MSKFGLFGKIVATEGNQDKLLQILKNASSEMEQLETCDLYVVSVNPEDSDAVYVFEVWENEQRHQDSLSQKVTQELIQQAKPIIAGMERLQTLQVERDASF